MSKIKLYIASTLDGYIAREDGKLDCLNNLPHPEGVDYGYSDFYSKMDTVIMGKRIPLFRNQPKETSLQLIKSEAFKSGIVNLHYKINH